ncbi:hypothetical protein pb186bvf_020699, partial [Paramecium bursaria]
MNILVINVIVFLRKHKNVVIYNHLSFKTLTVTLIFGPGIYLWYFKQL